MRKWGRGLAAAAIALAAFANEAAGQPKLEVYISADMEGVAGVVTGADLIREKAGRSIGRLRAFKPYRVKAPVTLDVRWKNDRPAVLAYLPIVERTDAHSIRFQARDMLEVIRFLEFMLNDEPG